MKKSDLLGHQFRLVGFGYGNHPQKEGAKIQFTFFHKLNSSQYCICLSDVSPSQVNDFTPVLRQQLGTIVGHEEIIPYVQRGVDGASYSQFRKIMAQLNIQIEWWEAGELN